jgi:hypothetical protein
MWQSLAMCCTVHCMACDAAAAAVAAVAATPPPAFAIKHLARLLDLRSASLCCHPCQHRHAAAAAAVAPDDCRIAVATAA